MSRLGSDLAAAGCLDSPDDYVHLEAEELLGAFDGTSTHARSAPLGTSTERLLPTVMQSSGASGQFHDRRPTDRRRGSSVHCREKPCGRELWHRCW